jgi:RNA polymerase II subunit A-like phosphatase
VQVVTPDWLWCCAERWEHVDEALFTLSKRAHVTLKPPAHCSSPEIAFAERCAVSLQRQQSSTESLPEAMNPFLTFSKDDLSGMGKEVEDELTDSSSSSSENTQLKRKANDEDSSSEDSLSADAPKGWQSESKRSRADDDDSRGGEEEDEDDEEEDEFSKAMAESMERELFEDASN